ncbi:MAG: OmpH family outer membrane protein [Chitinophagaceae bacterium]|nr:OmpH family outer membrane protein [Chitinophagaceae bacterium]
MKKLQVLAIVVVMLITNNAMAQTKFGYIRVDDVVALMPATAKIDSLLELYQRDTIQPEYSSLVEQYQFNDSLYRDSLKTPKSVRDEIAKKLPGLIYQIQNWQQISQQALEAKQNQLLSPIYNEVYTAIRAVAKEKGYTHVLNKEAFLVAPEGDDMIVAVATKLKLKLPPQLQQAAKPAGAR